eukprot:RCo006679
MPSSFALCSFPCSQSRLLTSSIFCFSEQLFRFHLSSVYLCFDGCCERRPILSSFAFHLSFWATLFSKFHPCSPLAVQIATFQILVCCTHCRLLFGKARTCPTTIATRFHF